MSWALSDCRNRTTTISKPPVERYWRSGERMIHAQRRQKDTRHSLNWRGYIPRSEKLKEAMRVWSTRNAIHTSTTITRAGITARRILLICHLSVLALSSISTKLIKRTIFLQKLTKKGRKPKRKSSRLFVESTAIDYLSNIKTNVVFTNSLIDYELS